MIRSLSSMVQLLVKGHVVSSSGHTRSVYNCFTFDAFGAGPYPPNKLVVATAFGGQWNTFVAPYLSTDYTAFGIDVWYPSIPLDVFTASGFLQNNGGATGPRLPLNQSVYVGLDTGLRGRSFLGCKHYAPIVESDVTGDELNASGLSHWNAASFNICLPFFTGFPLTTILWHPVVWSRVLSQSPPSTFPQVGADITGYSLIKTLSSWRHRRERTVTL